jgi:hypothetical protein
MARSPGENLGVGELVDTDLGITGKVTLIVSVLLISWHVSIMQVLLLRFVSPVSRIVVE